MKNSPYTSKKSKLPRIAVLTAVLLSSLMGIIYFYNSQKNDTIVLNYYSQPDKNGVLKEIISDFENINPGIKINLIELPDNTDDKLIVIKNSFQSETEMADVFDSDSVWPAIFASAGWVEPLGEYLDEDEKSAFLESSLNSNYFKDELWGFPYRIDSGMLYYRSDLLEKYDKRVPLTWEELAQTSQYIMKREGGDLKGFTSSWAQFEGLTANAVEYIWAFGGDILSEDSATSVLDSRESAEGISFMKDMIYKYRITPENITEFTSKESRDAFMKGDVIFMRDWSSGWRLLQDKENSNVSGKVKISEIPIGSIKGDNRPVLGGWQIMVSSFSDHKDEAVLFAKYRSGVESQKKGAIELSYLPSLKALYNDDEINAAMPFLKYMYPSFKNSNPRPVSPYYADMSKIIQAEVHKTLIDQQTPVQTVKDIDYQIKQIFETRPEYK